MTDPVKSLRDPLAVDEEFEQPSLEQWRIAATAGLGGGLERLVSQVAPGVPVGPLCTEHDAAAAGFPGLSPFTRGPRLLGHAAGGWEICQRVSHPIPGQAAALAAEEVRGGATGIWVSFARSPDARLVAADLAPIVAAIDPTRIAVHLEGRGWGWALAASWVAACARQGIDPSRLTGSLGWDPLGALAAGGSLPNDLDTGFALVSQLAGWSHANAPGVRAIMVDTLPHHQAGADPVQELAIAAATGVEYLQRMAANGIAPDAALGQIRFRIAVGRDLFGEMAKLRALRRMWSRVADAFGAAPSPASIHAVTSPRCLARRDHWVNMLRTTVATFAAAAGGAEAVTALPFDAVFERPGELGRRIARNVHTILMAEGHLHRIADPAGGSYLVEQLTDRLARAGWTMFQEIEREGGMAAALLSGAVAGRLADALQRNTLAVATRRRPITGVSTYPNLDEEPPDAGVPPPDPHLEQAGDVAEVDPGQVEDPATSEAGSEPGFEAAVAAAAAGESLRRIAAASGGGARPARVDALPEIREAEPFEALRDASDRHLLRTGTRPAAFLASIGAVSEHRRRSDFARDLLAAGGLLSAGGDGFSDAAEAVAAFVSSGTRTAVICSADQRYMELVPALAAALKNAGGRVVLVAGTPPPVEAAWRDAGVDGFLHEGCDAVAVLATLLEAEGVAVD